jgi:hypothetical protein
MHSIDVLSRSKSSVEALLDAPVYERAQGSPPCKLVRDSQFFSLDLLL